MVDLINYGSCVEKCQQHGFLSLLRCVHKRSPAALVLYIHISVPLDVLENDINLSFFGAAPKVAVVQLLRSLLKYRIN